MELWKLILMAVVLTALVVLFIGPGMWSSDADPLLYKSWRFLKGGRKNKKE